MKIDSTPSQVATTALQNIPFSSIIGAPLSACIEAQAQAAQTTYNFIQQVGMQTVDENGEKSTINVSFTFRHNGKMARLNIPLLTIVPIPYIAIQNIDISFKANISASSSTAQEESSSTEANLSGSGSANMRFGLFKSLTVKMEMKGGVSSKRDSRATQDSKYSVEYTMDVGIRAGQDSMPAGLAKVLEILNSTIDISDPQGVLGVNDNFHILPEGGIVELIATYKSPDGLYAPSEIKQTGGTIKSEKISGNSKVFTVETEGTYNISAGELTEAVEVKKATPATSIKM